MAERHRNETRRMEDRRGSMSNYTPSAEELVLAAVNIPEAEARRGIAKIKADAWDEGYETGCSSPYGTATPSGKPYDPEPNPYRE